MTALRVGAGEREREIRRDLLGGAGSAGFGGRRVLRPVPRSRVLPRTRMLTDDAYILGFCRLVGF